MILFFFDVNDFKITDETLKFIPIKILNKINRNVKQVNKIIILISFLMKIYLIEFFKLKPNKILLKKNKFGKPYIELDELELKFNISHDPNYIVLAYNNNNEIGVDIINLNRKINIDNLKKILHYEELEFLNASLCKKYTFLKIWTYKEAYLKLIGTGLSVTKNDKICFLPTNDIDYEKFHMNNINFIKKTPVIKKLLNEEKCFLIELEIKGRYNISIATLDKQIIDSIIFLNNDILFLDNIRDLLIIFNKSCN